MVPHCNSKGTVEELHRDELGIETKGQPENFCTKVDIANELLITDAIRKQFPTHCIVGEESVGTGQIPPQSSWQPQPTWIIDPIDGTTNFASALPLTCVSIGYCQPPHGTPVMGVVFSPMTQELFLAIRGYGAYRNGVRLASDASSSSSSPRTTELIHAVVNTEFGYVRSKEGIAKMIQALQRVMEHGCRTVRQLGSGVLDLCYVASGRLDVVYAGLDSEGWKPWDYCAALVIVQEAGCVMEPIVISHLDSNSHQTVGVFDLYSSSVICAATPELLRECRQVITGTQSSH
jgi:fructose-1,6-bisphosphatase/inositol monophosphatase family enzyme